MNAAKWLLCLLLAGVALLPVSCDSGDIYPEDTRYDEGITVEGSFELLSPEAFPTSGYDFIFGVFGGGTTALASVSVVRPADGQPLEVKLENIPGESTSARLCLVNTGRQVVYTFFEYEIDGDGPTNIVIPSAQIDLLKYDRIQQTIFRQYTCTTCHQGSNPAGGMLLTEGNSYAQLVGRPSNRYPGRNRVTANDPDNSLLLDVLGDGTLLTPPHTAFITREADKDLLRIWIEAGCPNN